MKLGSLCTGYGGLDLAVEALLPTETVWLSEIDKNAAKVCEARFPGVPNLGDLTVIDWSEVEPVDVLTAGYPCQPFSHAGKRQGTNDVRHIWPFILDALRVLRPRLALFENVAGHLSLGFDAVLGDLASVGFDAEWCVVRASDVGACHQRKRLFIAARDADGPREDAHTQGGRSRGAARQSGRRPSANPGSATGGRNTGAPPRAEEPARRRSADEGDRAVPVRADAPSNADDIGHERAGGARRRGLGSQDRRGSAADSRHGGLARPRMDERWGQDASGRGSVDWGVYRPAIRRHELLTGRAAPHPADERRKLSASFVEWMMCLPAGWVTDILPRNPALKALGNGVVPPQAAYAISHLLERHEAAERAA